MRRMRAVKSHRWRSCRFSMRTTRCGNVSGCRAKCSKSNWATGANSWLTHPQCWSCQRITTDRRNRVREASLPLQLSTELTAGLKQLSKREGVTLFMTLLAAWQLLLARYSRQPDVVVGSPVANRTRSEVEGLIGFFVNTLVLRTQVDGELRARELLQRVREVCLGAYAHQEVPFEMLVEQLQPERNMSHTPLFQVMLNLLNVDRKSTRLNSSHVSA